MSRRKLNQTGVIHHLALIVVVLAVAIGGTAVLVASHADTTNPTGWTLIGKVAMPQQNETITAYGCETKLSGTSRQVEGLFSLSSSYKTTNGFAWTASIINGSPTPVKNNQSVYGNFTDSTSPEVELKMLVSSTTSNPLSFSYSAGTPTKGGTSVMGNIAQNVYPSHFATCQDKS